MQEIFGFACFSLDRSGQKFFGFSEYLAALALMVVAWTIADMKYKFRISTAAFPILNLSYFLLAFVGVATLVTDMWRAGGRCVVAGNLVTPSGWQGFLGAIFLFVFLTWAWFAFIFPSKFGRWNGALYWKALHRMILKSNADECRVIGEELGRSATSIVRFAWTREDYTKVYGSGERRRFFLINLWNKSRFYADDILNLIGDARFCKYLVQTSSVAVLEIFGAVVEKKKFGIPIRVFARNITTEAINYKDSFVYNEVGRYANGYLGQKKTFTTMLYGNYELIESMGIVYHTYLNAHKSWDSDQWEAYFRLVLMTMQNFAEVRNVGQGSKVLSIVMTDLQMVASPNIDFVNVGHDWYNNDEYRKFNKICNFLRESIVVLGKDNPDDLGRVKISANNGGHEIYDEIAHAIYRIIVSASMLKDNRDYCFAVQYRTVWSNFFRGGVITDVSKLISYKVRRLIYNEIVLLQTMPNYEGANLLAMLMNISGFSGNRGLRGKDMELFHKIILRWLQHNYVSLVSKNKSVAESCLIEGIEYDPVGFRLVKTLQSFAGRAPSEQILLLVAPTS